MTGISIHITNPLRMPGWQFQLAVQADCIVLPWTMHPHVRWCQCRSSCTFSWYDVVQMEDLNLSLNDFTGAVPSSWANLTKVRNHEVDTHLHYHCLICSSLISILSGLVGSVAATHASLQLPYEKANDTLYRMHGLAAAGNFLAKWKPTNRGVDKHLQHTHTGTTTPCLPYHSSIADVKWS